MIGISISMMPWAHTFDMHGLTDLSQYFAIFESYETSANARKFLRGLRELNSRIVDMVNAHNVFKASAAGNQGPPADRASSEEESENGEQDFEGGPVEGEQGNRPPVSSTSTSVGDIVRNEKKVCG